MKKGEKMVKGYKPWEKMILDGTVKGEKATLEEAKRKSKGMPPSPALVDICARVLKRPVEDPLKYPFPDEATANNFRSALAQYVTRIGKQEELHVSRCESTVYIYRKDTTPTAS